MGNNLVRGCPWPATSDRNLPEKCGSGAALGILCVQSGGSGGSLGAQHSISVLVLYRDPSGIQTRGRMGDFRGAQLAALIDVNTEMLFQLQVFGRLGKMAHDSKCRDLE